MRNFTGLLGVKAGFGLIMLGAVALSTSTAVAQEGSAFSAVTPAPAPQKSAAEPAPAAPAVLPQTEEQADPAPADDGPALEQIGQENYEFEPFPPSASPAEGIVVLDDDADALMPAPKLQDPTPMEAEEPAIEEATVPEPIEAEEAVMDEPAMEEMAAEEIAAEEVADEMEVPPAPPIEPEDEAPIQEQAQQPEPQPEPVQQAPAQQPPAPVIGGWSNPDASGGKRPISDGLDPMREAIGGGN